MGMQIRTSQCDYVFFNPGSFNDVIGAHFRGGALITDLAQNDPLPPISQENRWVVTRITPLLMRANIRCKALVVCQTIRDAARNGRFELRASGLLHENATPKNGLNAQHVSGMLTEMAFHLGAAG